MPITMNIRGITKDDYEYVVSVLDDWWGGPAGQGAHPIFFHELGQEALIAENEGAIVGFLFGFVAPTDPRTGYVHLVGIHPEHRRGGVGKSLYARFIENCASAGASQMKAITTPGNDGSVRFHEALGFSVNSDSHYAGRDRSRIIFTKDL